MATINGEVAKWIEVLRQQWLGPVNLEWKFSARFLCAFVGSLTVFGTAIPFRIADDIQRVLFDPLFNVSFLFVLIPLIVIPSAWFAWLVSWKDFGHGPVRLYLSAIILPILVWSIISKALGIN